MSNNGKLGEKFERLYGIMKRLRAPGGCPWDREQTPASLRRFIVEEAYELLDAINSGDTAHIEEELGDLLLQIVFQAAIGEEREGGLTMAGVIDRLAEKLIRRHPHIFGEGRADTADEVIIKWEEIKKQEKPERRKSAFDGLPGGLPALVEARLISERVVKLGFEWPDLAGIWAKLDEESGELKEAITGDGDVSHELGDLLFVAVNLGRRLGHDSETALLECNSRFRRRFMELEKLLDPARAVEGVYPIAYLDELWTEVKRRLEREKE